MADLLTSIREGKYDKHLDRIMVAVVGRKKAIGVQLFYELEIGDKVRFLRTVRPTYLQGATGRVMQRRHSKVVVQLDDPVGRFRGGVISHPQSLEKITHPDADKLQALGNEIAGVLNTDRES